MKLCSQTMANCRILVSLCLLACSTALTIHTGANVTTNLTAAAGSNATNRPMPAVEHQKTPGASYGGSTPKKAEPAKPVTMPVSTTMKCIVGLTGLYFAVFAMKLILETLNEVGELDRATEEKAMALAKDTVFFVPMLCVLFLATRLRAIELSQGRTEEFELPPWWVKQAMIICSWAVSLTTLLVVFAAFYWGENWEAVARNESASFGRRFCIVVKSFFSMHLYAGFTVVCVGVVSMKAPEELWGDGVAPKVSPSLICTLILTVLFFGIHLCYATVKASFEGGVFGPSRRVKFTQDLLKTLAVTVSFSSMLCVLFLAARLRATVLAPEEGGLQRWVQASFFLCTTGMLLQTVLAGASFAVVGDKDGEEGGGSTPDGLKLQMIEAVRMVAVLFLFIGVVVLLLGMFILVDSAAATALSQSPMFMATGSCMFMSALYFSVYFVIGVIDTIQRIRLVPPSSSQRKDSLGNLKDFFLNRTQEAIQLFPMLSMLLLGAAMRASQLAGAIELKYSGYAARLAVIAVSVLAFARLDEVFPNTQKSVAVMCEVVMYFSFLCLYASTGVILVEGFVLT